MLFADTSHARAPGRNNTTHHSSPGGVAPELRLKPASGLTGGGGGPPLTEGARDSQGVGEPKGAGSRLTSQSGKALGSLDAGPRFLKACPAVARGLWQQHLIPNLHPDDSSGLKCPLSPSCCASSTPALGTLSIDAVSRQVERLTSTCRCSLFVAGVLWARAEAGVWPSAPLVPDGH